jgi:hypothetical protein
MARILTTFVASVLLAACGGDEPGGSTGGGAGDDGGSTATGGASDALRAAVEAFCDAGCACSSCGDQDRADCVEAYLGYELPGSGRCDERYVAAFTCATERQAACDEEPVASLESCATAGSCG